MGLFSAPHGTNMYYSNSPIRSHPELHRRGSKEKDVEEPEPDNSKDDNDEDELAKPETPIKEKKVIKVKNRDKFDPQTLKNTHLNSLMYHTSEDTIDLYARENDSSDLLGRLYYDDFDSDSAASTPLMSPSGPVVGNDYFGSRPLSPGPFSAVSTPGAGTPGAATPVPFTVPNSLAVSRTASYTNMKSISAASLTDKLKEHSQYSKGVSFDTSTNSDRKSLTLKVKHPRFKFRRNNKTYLTGFNNDSESLNAIKWLFDEMIINGDTIIVFQVLDEKLHREIDRQVCTKTLDKIKELNVHHKKIAIVYEVVIGKPQKLLKKAIDEYSPQLMAIGMHDADNKGLFAKTTMSKYFLQYALVPVIVVKPTYNHIEALKKPIETESYFQDWLANIDVSQTYIRDKDKKKKLNSSLASLAEERGRGRSQDEDEFKFRFLLSNSRSPSSSRSASQSRDDAKSDSKSQKRSGLSKFFHH